MDYRLRFRHQRWVLTCIFLITGNAAAQAEHNPLLPAPQRITYGAGALPLAGLPIRLSSGTNEDDRFAAQTLSVCVSQSTGAPGAILDSDADSAIPGIALSRTGPPDPLPVPGETAGPDSREAYTLTIKPGGAEVRARSSAGPLLWRADPLSDD